MEKSKAMPVIIGGMVFDIHATASVPSTAKSTTPGKIQFMLGGVARNIAECLLKLGTKSFMISALGGDLTGDLLLEQWRSSGLLTEGELLGIRRSPNITTASVCNMFDINGDLMAGVASVESIERYVTPQWIQQFKSSVHSAPLLMVDANLSPEALEASCRMSADLDVPVWFEPVSVTKSKRVAGIAKYITFASPNEHELIAMANSLSNDNRFRPIQKDQDKTKNSIESIFKELKPAILLLLKKGIKYVLVTLGPDGAFLCSRGGPSDLKQCLNGSKKMDGKRELFDMVNSKCPANQYLYSTPNRGGFRLSVVHFPALPATVGRVSGAGDCLVGGSVASLCSGLNVMQSVAVGVAAAKAAIEADTNVPRIYNLSAVAGTT
ncbi:Pseudouridine kinase [Bienertia sinuspersici]